MARRAGGYKRADPTEWAECARALYGEAITSANRLGQDVFVWMNDAIAHHVYRVEALQAQERYQADYAAFVKSPLAAGAPDQRDPKYQVTRPKPEITRPSGQGAASSAPRPRP